MQNIELDKIEFVVKETLAKVGVSSEDAKIIADTILYAHKTGKGTHGITRLPIYVKKIRNGSLNPENKLDIVSEKQVISIVDANNGFGQIAAHFAMEKAISKAEVYGMGV